MAAFTKVKLAEVEDMAAGAGLSETQEARFAREPLGAEQIGLSLQKVKPGKRQAFGHSHGEDEEVYVILDGSGSMRLGEEVIEVAQMDAIRVAPGVTRAFEAGPDGLGFLAFGTHSDGDSEIDPGFWD